MAAVVAQCQYDFNEGKPTGEPVDTSWNVRRDVWRVGDLVIDEGQQLVMRGDEVIELPKLSFDLLLELVRNAPDVVSIDALLSRVWQGVVVNPETDSKMASVKETKWTEK